MGFSTHLPFFFTAWGHDLGTTSSPRWDSWLERFVEPPPNITLRVMDCPWPGQIYRGSCVTPKNGSDGQVGLGVGWGNSNSWDSFFGKTILRSCFLGKLFGNKSKCFCFSGTWDEVVNPRINKPSGKKGVMIGFNICHRKCKNLIMKGYSSHICLQLTFVAVRGGGSQRWNL